MDLGVTNRPGSRFGPRALRTIERIGPYNHVLDTAPVFDLRVADIGDVPFASRYRLEQSHDDIERRFNQIVGAGVVPLAVGGDHSITHPILKAVGKDAPGRADPYRRPLRHRRRLRPDQVPSWRAVPQCRARRRARPDADHPDRHSRLGRISVGVLLRVRNDGDPCRGNPGDGHQGGHREGAERSPATARPICPSTSTASTRPLRREPARLRSAA